MADRSWQQKSRNKFQTNQTRFGMVREKLSTFKDVLRVLTESFKGVSGKFMGCFKVVERYSDEILMKFQMCFKGVSKVFQGSFSEESSRCVQVRLNGISSSFKGFSRVLERRVVCQGSFKGVLRKFPRSFKEVSRVFQESFKGFSRKFRGCFKDD